MESSSEVKKHYKRNFWIHTADGFFNSIGIRLLGLDTIFPGFIRLILERIPLFQPYLLTEITK